MALTTTMTTRNVVYDDRSEQHTNIQEIQSSIATIRHFAEKAPPKSSLSLHIPMLILPKVHQALSAIPCQVYFDLETETLHLTMAPTAVHNAFSLFVDNAIRRQPRPDGFPLDAEDYFHHVGGSHIQQLPRPPNSQNPWSRIADGQVLFGKAQARKTTRLVYEVGHSQTDENLDSVVQDWIVRSDQHLRIIIACKIDEISLKNQIKRPDVRAERNRLLAMYGTKFAKEEAGIEEPSPTQTNSTLHSFTGNEDSADNGYITGAVDDLSDIGSPLSDLPSELIDPFCTDSDGTPFPESGKPNNLYQEIADAIMPEMWHSPLSVSWRAYRARFDNGGSRRFDLFYHAVLLEQGEKRHAPDLPITIGDLFPAHFWHNLKPEMTGDQDPVPKPSLESPLITLKPTKYLEFLTGATQTLATYRAIEFLRKKPEACFEDPQFDHTSSASPELSVPPESGTPSSPPQTAKKLVPPNKASTTTSSPSKKPNESRVSPRSNKGKAPERYDSMTWSTGAYGGYEGYASPEPIRD